MANIFRAKSLISRTGVFSNEVLSPNLIYNTGDQNISGIKSFYSRPTVNGTGVLLSGEAGQVPDTVVQTSGTQTISGNKTFITTTTFTAPTTFSNNITVSQTGIFGSMDVSVDEMSISGLNLILTSGTGIFNNDIDLNNSRVLNASNLAYLTGLQSTGLILNNSIISLSGLFTGFTGNLDATYATDTQLFNTGSTLQTNINNLSNTYATINNLASTGSTLDIKIGSLSGTLTSTYATITNLALTGSTLISSINSLNNNFTGFTGNLDSTYATDTQLFNTGSTLDIKINSLSGSLNSSGINLNNRINLLSGVSVLSYGDQNITGNKTFINNIEVQGTGIFNALDLSNISDFSFSGVTINLIDSIVQSSGQIYISGNPVLTGVDLSSYATNYTLNSSIDSLSGSLNSSGIILTNSINSLSGSLNSSGLNLSNSIDSLSGSLNSSGINLNNSIISLSGLFTGYTGNLDSTFATDIQLQNTGSTLSQNINSLSGTLTNDYYLKSNPSGFITGVDLSSYLTSSTASSTYATITNLANTGSNLVSSINSFSGLFTGFTGNLDATYATDIQLLNTGITLNNSINSLSGVSVLTYGNQNITGNKTFINNITVSGTGTFNAIDLDNIDNLSLSGIDVTIINSNVNVSGNIFISGNPVLTGVDLSSYAITTNLILTGSTLDTKINDLSGYVNAQDNNISTNLYNTGSTLDIKINTLSGSSVLLYGNQTISGLKDFTTRPTVNTTPVLLSGEATDGLHVFVKNDDSVTLRKGQPVYINGANGANILVKRSDYIGDNTSSKTLGLLAQDLAPNDQGFVITEGDLHDVDTSLAGSAGDAIWLGPTGSVIYGLVNKPYAPNHLVYLGVVERKHENVGKIYVKVQNGFELEELHNVNIDHKNVLNDNDIIRYNSASGIWFNETLNTGTFQTQINSLSGSSVLLYGDQTIDGTKTFRDNVYIHDLYVTGTEFIANVENNFIQSPYILLNLTGGAVDGGIFFVTGAGLTGINDLGPIIGFDHTDKFKFGISSRGADLSTLNDIAAFQDITAYSGFVDGKYATIINLASTGSTLSTNLASTGSTLQTQINNLGTTYATVTNLASTGSTLDSKINSLSGTLTSTYATISNLASTGSTLTTNLASTGSTLNSSINSLSGTLTSDYATISNLASTGSTLATNLASTGSTLQTNINNLSGYINSTGSNILFTTGDQTINGNKSFTSSSTLTIKTISGFKGSSPESLNLIASNDNTVISNVNLPGNINLTAGTGSTFGTSTYGNINLNAGGPKYEGQVNLFGNVSINNTNSNTLLNSRTIKIYKTGFYFGNPATAEALTIDNNNISINTVAGGGPGFGLLISGVPVTPALYATITNLASTGSTLDTKINSLSGTLTSTYATITNLASTGSTLVGSINSLSGTLTSTYATITNLASTGSTLNTKINNLSGYINSTSSNIVFTTGNQNIGGNKTFTGVTTFSGQEVNLVDTALNLSGLGDMTFSGTNINFINSPVFISGTNLRVAGDVLGNNLVYNTGSQIISGIKTFATGVNISGNVGIGTITPAAKLHIAGPPALLNTTMEDILYLQRPFNAGVSFGSRAVFKLGRHSADGSQSHTRLDIALRSGSDTSTNINAPEINVMTLRADGKVGIGTTTPNERLTVIGNVNVSGNLNVTGNSNIRGTLDVTGLVVSGLGAPFILKSASNGNSVYFDPLEAGQQGVLYANRITINSISGPTGDSDLPILYNTIKTTKVLKFQTSDGGFGVLNRAILDSNGNFGIGSGISSVPSRFYVSGNSILQGDLTVSGTLTTNQRPFVNGTGVLLSGEAAQVDLSTTVRTTGDQTVSGIKDFQSVPLVSGREVYYQKNIVYFTGNNFTPDSNLARTFEYVLTGLAGASATLNAPINMSNGENIVIKIKQSSSGSNNIIFNAAYKFPGGVSPSLTLTPSKADIYTALKIDSNFYSTYVKDFID